MQIRGAEKLSGVPQTTSRRLTSSLVRAILQGTYDAGERLPTERDLSESLGVSRHTLREALKRLEAMGLLAIRQGAGVFVNNVALSGGIELLEYILVDEEGRMDTAVLRDFFQFWSHFLGEMVALATLRWSDEERRALESQLLARRHSLRDGGTSSELWKQDAMILHNLAGAAHSPMFRLAFNTLFRSVLRLLDREPFSALELQIPQRYLEELLQAMNTREPQTAADTVRLQVEQAGAIFLELFEALQ